MSPREIIGKGNKGQENNSINRTNFSSLHIVHKKIIRRNKGTRKKEKKSSLEIQLEKVVILIVIAMTSMAVKTARDLFPRNKFSK